MNQTAARRLADPQFSSDVADPRQPEAFGVSDLVRRCRWIAVDINATAFTLCVIESSMERQRLAACFDSEHPRLSPATRYLSGSMGEDLIRHARRSTLPCRWAGNEDAEAPAARIPDEWTVEIPALVPETPGIAFPVYGERGQNGLVLFFGGDIALSADQLPEIHGRCFSLFAATMRSRSIDLARLPTISRRERECLKLTANGHTSEEIAKLLKLSVHTANQYLANTVQKLNAVNRMHAVAKALRLGLIE